MLGREWPTVTAMLNIEECYAERHAQMFRRVRAEGMSLLAGRRHDRNERAKVVPLERVGKVSSDS
jgi:hypothetical protein